MDVSVVIVNYNTKDLIIKCIESIYRETKDVDFEIIVVDNASIDDSTQYIKKHFPQVLIVQNDENLGFGKANNHGVNFATGRYLFFLNPDTIILNNAINVLFEFISSNSNIGVCGGNLFDEKYKPIHSHRLFFPGFFQELNALLGGLLYSNMKDVYNPTKSSMEVAYITGADLMIRKDLFLKLKGFDEQFFMYYEETDLCFRVKKNGFKIVNLPLSNIIHLEGQSFNLKVTREQLYFDSRKKFLCKTYSKFYYYLCNILYFMHCISRIMLFFLYPKYSNKLSLWSFRLKLLLK